ncbi:nuclear transport factor 2 family protein [Actinoplanes derwentensis]|uniref:Predicted SnoaL-like aldol condensation-catalyzing enzyme n=1 Tax=Actinoplanes derwentensis TaxID=113562 RepID=A0A1H1Y3T2_9ACTN|nr:nuclear transport factor 2 family protein [Actinoplanes derwentensis]GID86735.1 polyketide cyclase [Actinoplanes derwentensis]SDT16073.1 Predicted SnoaL-like aldol condensation-catalyzing enzyme [Actinoplanes derwentensis]
MSAKEIVLTAAGQLFGDKDPSAVDRWAAATYRQHSALAADGPEGLRDLVGSLSDGFRYDLHRVVADGDLVALHGTYHGFGPEPLVAFDVFRVADGKLAEHWDALAPVVTSTVSGRSQTDGPTTVTDLGQTEANRVLVTDFVETVLKGGKVDTITDYLSTETYHQHNIGIGDGLDGLGAALTALAQQGVTMTYHAVHRVIAEGNFVLTVSEGSFGPTPTAFYDLFRVDCGRIVEHWDITPEIPAGLPHPNGLF